jgi:hypothetical protein
MKAKTHRRPLVVATTVLLAGAAASLAGNVQAIYLDNEAPGVGAVISAVIWPLFLLGAIELLIHTPWLANWRDNLTKLAVTVFVGAVAAYLSYFHLAHVLSAYGYDTVSRYAGPLAIDAAMAMATLALNRVGQARRVGQMAKAAGMVLSYARPIGPMPAPVVAKPVQVASVADEATHYLERLAGELDASTTPAAPIEVTSVGPAVPARVRPESVPETARELIQAWASAPAKDRPRAGQADEAVAAVHSVSPRTARGWRDALVKTGA